MVPGHPLVSVIVVNWNRRDFLRSCLRSLAQQELRDLEVIVVDNGSTDGSIELLREGEFAGVRKIQNPENRGFCAANNQGIRLAQGKYIALLNNDAEADPAWLRELVQALESHPGAGMAASKIVDHDDHSLIDKAGHLIYPDGQNRGRGTGERDQGQYDRLEETAWPDGCAAIYRRELFDQVGGFDEDFFAYADDAELGLRARIAGWQCVYVPKAIVRHRHGSTLGRYSEQRIFLIERNRVWLAAKLFPWRLLLLNPFYFGARVVATAVASGLGRGEISRVADTMSLYRLLKCLIRANLAALAGLPRMLRKRRELDSVRKLSAAEVVQVVRRFRISLKELVLQAR